MKKLKLIVSLFVLTILSSCTEDSGNVNLDAVSAPKVEQALVTITQDNSGNVTFLPRGEGVSQYKIYFADGTLEPASVNVGGTTTHKYSEGVYEVKIIGTTVNGKTTEFIQEVTVSFLQPTNLQVTIAKDSSNNYSINVTGKANLETNFQIYFGDVPNEIPAEFMEGETVSHKYAALGSYVVRVVALSGGAAKTEYTETVVISDPILLPITFETTTPVFGNFGNATSVVANNPSISAANGSSKVAKLTKATGSEVWAGSSIELGATIDFSSKKIMKMKVWSPKAGIIVKMKLERLLATNPDPTNIEVDATTKLAGAWEELSYDFSAINNANNYQRVVVFFDFGNVGTGANYFYDDIQLVSGAPAVALPLDFETPTIISGNFGGATTISIANPKSDANNSSANVGSSTKTPTGEVWGGSYITLTSPINFTTQKKMKMKVWSPRVGMPVLLKVENLTNPAISKEIIVPTTVAGAWETLTFDFTTLDLSGGKTYQKVVWIFDNATKGAPTTFYFDDIQQSN